MRLERGNQAKIWQTHNHKYCGITSFKRLASKRCADHRIYGMPLPPGLFYNGGLDLEIVNSLAPVMSAQMWMLYFAIHSSNQKVYKMVFAMEKRTWKSTWIKENCPSFPSQVKIFLFLAVGFEPITFWPHRSDFYSTLRPVQYIDHTANKNLWRHSMQSSALLLLPVHSSEYST